MDLPVSCGLPVQSPVPRFSGKAPRVVKSAPGQAKRGFGLCRLGNLSSVVGIGTGIGTGMTPPLR